MSFPPFPKVLIKKKKKIPIPSKKAPQIITSFFPDKNVNINKASSIIKNEQTKNQIQEPDFPTFYKEKLSRHSHLRQKFINSALSFLGVPYGKKYLEYHPEYNSSLFLDCCGLVRHSFNQLKHEFGFSLGKWNQCYQYDILPEKISFKEMKPGDLIFYTGIYYPDKNKKQQIHNLVHVEIYLGEGEKTIGSRDSSGVVSIYDTFQFESSNYYNIQYHFKSIDTWLKGIHKSFCKVHRWTDKHKQIMSPNKIQKTKYEDIILNEYRILQLKRAFMQQQNILLQEQIDLLSKSKFKDITQKKLYKKKNKSTNERNNNNNISLNNNSSILYLQD